MSTRSVDFVLLTPLQEEWDAMCACFTGPLDMDAGSGDYLAAVGQLGRYRAVVCKPPGGKRSGNYVAAAFTQQVIAEWRPRWVLLVGIAGSLNEDVKPGDVVLVSKVYGYDFGKIDGGKYIRRGDYDSDIAGEWVDHLVLLRAQGFDATIASQSSLAATFNTLGGLRPPVLHLGPIASGEKVVDDLGHVFLDEAYKNIVDAIAVEMEAAGAATAVKGQSGRHRVGFLSIRGISDVPRVSGKDPEHVGGLGTSERDRWKGYAATVAALTVRQLFGRPGIPKGKRSRPLLAKEPSQESCRTSTNVQANEQQAKPIDRNQAALEVPLFQRQSDPLLVVAFPDLLTPAPSDDQMLTALAPLIGETTGRHLVALSKRAVAATEIGDFREFVTIGTELEAAAGGEKAVLAAGYYLAAEGYRLQADLERDIVPRKALLDKAVTNYSLALSVERSYPRALRGLGRVYEVQGELDKGIPLFEQAKALTTLQLSMSTPAARRGLAHEILRSTRHYVEALLRVRDTSPGSSWHLEQKERQLEGYIVECQNFHYEFIPLFGANEHWSLFEWFSGLVFLSKAWGSLGYVTQAVQCLTHALLARRLMLGASSMLTEVERANVRWWFTTASSLPRVKSTREFLSGAEKIGDALVSGHSALILHAIDQFLSQTLPPWQQGVIQTGRIGE